MNAGSRKAKDPTGSRPTGVLVEVVNGSHTGSQRGPLVTLKDFPRPRRFQLAPGQRVPIECVGPSYLIPFRDAGRYFQFQVVLGGKVTPAVKLQVEAVLNSLKVRRG